MPVLSGASGAGIAEKLAPILDMEYVSLESRRFPDGEAYVRIPLESIESVRSESVVLVSNTFPDSGIMQTLLLLGAIRDVRRGDLSSLKDEWGGSTEDVGPGVFLAIPYYEISVNIVSDTNSILGFSMKLLHSPILYLTVVLSVFYLPGVVLHLIY